MEAVEATLGHLPPGETFSGRQFAQSLHAGLRRDQIRTALGALVEAGALERVGLDEYLVVREAQRGAEARHAMLDTLRWVESNPRYGRASLLVGAPAIGPQQAGYPFERYFADIRTAVRGLVASAKAQLLLASPFWDTDVVAELVPLIERRLDAGVGVQVLTRAPVVGSVGAQALRMLGDVRVGASRCDVRILEERSVLDPFGRATFHFKIVSADGVRVYLGSANLNTAGMASRWELGVIMADAQARRISELVSALLVAARPAVNL
jgi:phosphatidylserine/phosphatidylglycerophosphate/cardiolipin synthase-like enzyme